MYNHSLIKCLNHVYIADKLFSRHHIYQGTFDRVLDRLHNENITSAIYTIVDVYLPNHGD